MTRTTAKGTFDITVWTPQQPVHEGDGVTVQLVTIDKTWHGDLTGSSVVTMLTATTPVENSRSYVAMERFEGTLYGRPGSFVVQHDAVSDAGAESLLARVVPDSATGELRGLRGEIGITIAPDGTHSYTFGHTL